MGQTISLLTPYDLDLMFAVGLTKAWHFSDTDSLNEQSLFYKLPIYKHCMSLHLVSGSTALVAVISGDKLTVANVGDSRGVMCDKDGKAIPLSADHKPNQVCFHSTVPELFTHNTFLKLIQS